MTHRSSLGLSERAAMPISSPPAKATPSDIDQEAEHSRSLKIQQHLCDLSINLSPTKLSTI